MINCLKFVCSKKLVDTIFHLLNTIQANVTFLSTGRKSKIICRMWISSSFTFRQKNINCSNCNWSTKVLENVNCSTQFIVKKMVYMYGSQVRGQVRLGQVRLGQVRLGVHVWQLGQVFIYGSQVRCQVRLSQVMLGQVRLGQVRLGQVRLGQVRLGVRLGRVVQVMNKYGR